MNVHCQQSSAASHINFDHIRSFQDGHVQHSQLGYHIYLLSGPGESSFHVCDWPPALAHIHTHTHTHTHTHSPIRSTHSTFSTGNSICPNIPKLLESESGKSILVSAESTVRRCPTRLRSECWREIIHSHLTSNQSDFSIGVGSQDSALCNSLTPHPRVTLCPYLVYKSTHPGPQGTPQVEDFGYDSVMWFEVATLIHTRWPETAVTSRCVRVLMLVSQET